jgi:5-methylcytosine-specific restriction enzyme A
VPTRPPKPCTTVGCANLSTQGGPCSLHRQAYDKRRGSAAQRGYNDPRHHAWRALVLANYTHCVDCHAPGDASDHADHIIPIREGGDWSVENGARRCKACHSRKTIGEQRKRGEV